MSGATRPALPSTKNRPGQDQTSRPRARGASQPRASVVSLLRPVPRDCRTPASNAAHTKSERSPENGRRRGQPSSRATYQSRRAPRAPAEVTFFVAPGARARKDRPNAGATTPTAAGSIASTVKSATAAATRLRASRASPRRETAPSELEITRAPRTPFAAGVTATTNVRASSPGAARRARSVRAVTSDMKALSLGQPGYAL